MNLATVSPILFIGGAFALATVLEPLWSGMQRQQAKSALELALGDGRRLFANHFFTKADIYFHNGYYPSVFDQLPKPAASHVSESAEEHAAHGAQAKHEEDEEEHEKEMDFLGESRDWIEAFGRNFFVSRHTHMKNAQAGELLPWFKIAAELDPTRVETYAVTAFWLRNALHKVDEAEEFLREGWKANPDSYAILLELGRLYETDRQDHERARNVWEFALKKWDQQESGKKEPDLFARQQILAHLADLEEKHGDMRKCIAYLEELARLSPYPEMIRQQIEERKARLAQ